MDITKQGLLLFRSDIKCYKKKALGSKWIESMIFVFRERILICEEEKQKVSVFSKAPVIQKTFLNYRVSFKVCITRLLRIIKGFYLFLFYQMNQVKIELKDSSTNELCFELGSQNAESILVKCQNIALGEECFKTIEDEINRIKEMLDKLRNPRATFGLEKPDSRSSQHSSIL